MSRKAFAVAVALAAAAELALSWRVPVRGATADLVLVVVILASTGRPPEETSPRAFVGGLITDILFGRRLGAFALSYALCAEAIAAARPYFFEEHPVTRLSSLAAGALGVELAGFAFNSLAEGALVPGGLAVCVKVGALTWLAGALAVGGLWLFRTARR